MKASPAAQLRLLDLAALDSTIKASEAARKNPPQAGRVQELLAQRHTLSTELTRLLGIRDDVAVELSRIESDVAVVTARSARDAARLGASTNAKEAQSLEHEIASLAKRKSDLEDAELQVMERLEQAEAEVTAQETLIAETNAKGARLSAEAKAAVADATARWETAMRDRAVVAADIPDELLTKYDRLAQRGVGAGLLQRRICEACRMELSGSDLALIAQTAEDEVVFCPQCSGILVRTYESGL